MRLFALIFISSLACIAFPQTGAATYQEECLSEGCSDEEVRELYSSYKEECINEGCSHEEVIELAGSAQAVDRMLDHFRRLGLDVPPGSTRGTGCRATGSIAKCAGILLMCQDWYWCPNGLVDICRPDDRFCPGGNTKSAWYVCGICFGFDWF